MNAHVTYPLDYTVIAPFIPILKLIVVVAQTVLAVTVPTDRHTITQKKYIDRTDNITYYVNANVVDKMMISFYLTLFWLLVLYTYMMFSCFHDRFSHAPNFIMVIS